MASFVTHATRGVIRDRATRRRAIFIVLVLALGMVLSGSTFLQPLLNAREHVLRFLLYWFACAWFTVTALLLALFDLLRVRAEGRAAQKELLPGKR